MEECSTIDCFIQKLESDILLINSKILESNEVNPNITAGILDVLDRICFVSDTECVFSPIVTTFISLVKTTRIYKCAAIDILIGKIDADIAYWFAIHNPDIENQGKDPLTSAERKYFMLDKDGKLRINNTFNPDGKSFVMFNEKDENGILWKKRYKIDLKTGYVIDQRKIKVANHNGMDLSEPHGDLSEITKMGTSKEEFDNIVNEIFGDTENSKEDD